MKYQCFSTLQPFSCLMLTFRKTQRKRKGWKVNIKKSATKSLIVDVRRSSKYLHHVLISAKIQHMIVPVLLQIYQSRCVYFDSCVFLNTRSAKLTSDANSAVLIPPYSCHVLVTNFHHVIYACVVVVYTIIILSLNVQQHNKLVWVVFSSICDMESFHTTYCVGKATELVRLKRLSSIHYYNECRKLRCANASRHVMLSLKSVRVLNIQQRE